ncbi:MAG: FAD-dependent oxidoreductase [Spirochaetota bacterium]
MERYDVVVIGAGSGGITCAVTAAGFGKRVLMVDRGRPGGECTWTGCVPSKALIHEASRVHNARTACPGLEYESASALSYARSVRERVYSHETPEALGGRGIEFRQGEARFTSAERLRVGDEEIAARRFIIASGSSTSARDGPNRFAPSAFSSPWDGGRIRTRSTSTPQESRTIAAGSQ